MIVKRMSIFRYSKSNIFANKRAQAIIETIFMLPFIIATIFFIYQAYLVVNKVQVVQKYLKGGIIGKVMNRNIITTDSWCDDKIAIPGTGRYFVIYNEKPSNCEAPPSEKYANINLGDTTITMMSYFCSDSQKPIFKNFLKSQKVWESLGLCVGGTDKMGLTVDASQVLTLSQGAICSEK
jgi:hypothetical protein